MANRRMFSLSIVDTDAFLDMPHTSQLLYFHLSMRADDDGFVANPKKIIRMTDAKEDDLKILSAKKFIIPFDSGVCVIKHWRMHNLIRKDRYTPTTYGEEFANLSLDENDAYTLATSRQPVGNQALPQVRLGKVSSGKDRLVQDSMSITPSQEAREFFSGGEITKNIIDQFLNRGIEESALTTEVQKFILYWTELNKTGKKQKWEMQKTFEVKRRLATWLNNSKQFNRTKKESKGIIL